MNFLVEHLQDIVIPGPLLWTGACIGHGFFWMVAVNWVYSFALPHRLLDCCRGTGMLLTLLSPLVFLHNFGFPQELHLTGYSAMPDRLGAVYLQFFFCMGVIVAPVAQAAYWLRKRAPQVIQRDAEVFDVAKQLGFPPRGHGKEAAVSRFPGNQVFQVEFVDLHLRLPQIPKAWEGLTLLHLTDLHFHEGMDRRFYQAVIGRCLEKGTPDLVCVTGDIVDSDWHHRWIVPLLGKLRWQEAGLFILGNHDTWHDTARVRRRFRRLGMQDLGNSCQQLQVRGQPMIVVGNETPWFKPEPRLESYPTDVFRLCLSHTPDVIRWARRQRIDLMLAGHVHGGQIRVPLLGSLLVPSWYSRRYDCGTFFEAPTVMHVGRGLAGKHMLRLNCRPEVTRVILHCDS